MHCFLDLYYVVNFGELLNYLVGGGRMMKSRVVNRRVTGEPNAIV